MVLLSDYVGGLFREFSSNFRHPGYLWWVLIAIVGIGLLVRWNAVRYGLDEKGRRRQARMRLIVYVLRTLAVISLIVAIATPISTISKETEGNPRALVLIDKSGSMGLYDTSFTEFLTKELSGRIPTTVKSFGSPEESPIGDAALGQSEHVLLVTDGNANTGVSLEDVAQVARQNNKTMNAIEISPLEYDAAVMVDAPQSVPLGFPPQIRVRVTGVNDDPIPLEVIMDGKTIYSDLARGTIELNPELGAGYHTIEARIGREDANAGNNVFYRVIEVLDKPKVFILSKQRGSFEAAVGGLFEAEVGTRLPTNLDPYYAVIINDRSSSQVGDAARLADFLRDESGGKQGNGLVVIGGFNSYDRGGYLNSPIESLLPVRVGKPKRELGENNLVFVIQVSGSTSGTRYVAAGGGQLKEIKDETPVVDIIKAQAVSAIESLNLKNNVGVVMFGASTEGQSHASAQETLAASVVKIAGIQPLYKQKKSIVDKVTAVQGGGTTAPDLALRAAVDMLKGKSGTKTIIFLSNGRFSAGLGDVNAGAKADVETVIANAYRKYGIKTHAIGVGSSSFDEAEFRRRVDEDFLVNMAKRSDGLYDRATNMARLILKYGDPNEKGFGDEFRLVTMSLTHFITRDLDLTAILNGYNEVAPKDGSRVLVQTDGGAPALTVWNYFNGRVAALTVFTGSGLGPLLSGDDSDLLRNTILWAVGDPRRKQDVSVTISPATVNREAEVTFTSKDPISGDCDDTPITFSRSSGDAYVFTFTPAAAGIFSVCNVPYAVNNPSEYWKVGVSDELRDAVSITGGRFFSFDQIDEIVERIKTVSQHVTLEKTDVRNPFVLIALVLFLLEIFIRRVARHGFG